MAFPGAEGLSDLQGRLSQGFQPSFQSGHLKGHLVWLKAAGIRLLSTRQRGGGERFLSLVMHLPPTWGTSCTSLKVPSPRPMVRKATASKS